MFVSATPGNWEMEVSGGEVAEQVIRPTGVLDPVVEVRPTTGQVDDLLGEIRDRAAKNQRVLVTTLTKRMAEDLTDYLAENEVRVRYLHSEIHSIERIEIIQDLRLGEYDVLVGVNLLREGLDLPEVSLVAILDADKEGFLRAERSLIQTIGRAARHVEGVALLYADNMTDSMAKAISETERRRAIQQTYNEKHGIVPTAAGKKASNSILSFLELSRKLKQDGPDADLVEVVGKAAQALENDPDAGMALEALPELIDQLESKMKEAAKKLDFEEAANLRDRVKQLRQKLNHLRCQLITPAARLAAAQIGAGIDHAGLTAAAEGLKAVGADGGLKLVVADAVVRQQVVHATTQAGHTVAEHRLVAHGVDWNPGIAGLANGAGGPRPPGQKLRGF